MKIACLSALLGGLLSFACGGCAAPQNKNWLTGDAAAERGRRSEEMQATFARQRDRAQLDAAKSCRRSGDAEGCRRELEDLLTRNPSHAEGRELLAQVQSESPAQSSSFGQAALAQLASAELALADGDVRAAESQLDQSLQLEPNDRQFRLKAATIALRHEQPALAVRLLEPTAQAVPGDLRELQTLATAYYRLGEYGSSQLVLRQALSLDNSSSLTYFLLGCTLDKLGHADEAAKCFAAARRSPGSIVRASSNLRR